MRSLRKTVSRCRRSQVGAKEQPEACQRGREPKMRELHQQAPTGEAVAQSTEQVALARPNG
jgi:hypothetical protein